MLPRHVSACFCVSLHFTSRLLSITLASRSDILCPSSAHLWPWDKAHEPVCPPSKSNIYRGQFALTQIPFLVPLFNTLYRRVTMHTGEDSLPFPLLSLSVSSETDRKCTLERMNAHAHVHAPTFWPPPPSPYHITDTNL